MRTPPNPDRPPVAWVTRQDTFLADCRVFTVHTRRCYHPEREIEQDFSVIYSPHWIQALARTPEGSFIMVNQFRFGRECFSWEMPGGLVDPGEELIAAAARELSEETGYVGENPRIIGESSPNPAIQNNLVTFVLFENCRLVNPLAWDNNEELEVGIFTLEETDRMIEDGRIHNATALNALFYYQRHMRAQ